MARRTTSAKALSPLHQRIAFAIEQPKRLVERLPQGNDLRDEMTGHFARFDTAARCPFNLFGKLGERPCAK